MNKFQWILVASGLGLIGGIYLGNTQKNLALTVGVGSGGALFGGGLVSALYQQKTKKLTVDFEQKIETITSERDKIKTEFELLQRIHRETCQLKDKSLLEVESLKNQIKILDNSLKDYQWRGDKDKEQIIEQKEVILKLSHQIEKLQETVDNKEAKLREFEHNYEEDLKEDVEIAFQKRAADVIEKEIKIDEEITSEAIELIRDYKSFLNEIMDRHQDNRDLLLDTNNKAKSHIINVVNSKNEAYNALLEEKEQLELQKQMLQQQLNGEILSPEKSVGKHGYNWTIGNSLIDHLWEQYEIPLRFTGLEENPDGSATLAFSYSKSANPEDICNTINLNGKQWAKIRGIHSIGNARVSNKYPAIEVFVRRDKPAQDTTEKVYQSGLIRAKLFAETLHKALDPKKGGKPTLRVMGATGDGKGIALKNYLEYLVKQSGWEIWLSDPVDGSTEDYWDCPKIATDASSAAKAYKKFLSLHDIREKDKIDGFTDLKVVGIFDEFDRNHSKEQHEEALRVMASIRHTRLRQVLVGQCAEVGKNGWTWGDMSNCSLLALEKSIGILKKHLKPDLGWTSAQFKKLEKDYNQFMKWRDEQNAENPDIPYENRTRLGLLIIGDSYQFLEVPIAYKGFIRSSGASIVRESFENTPVRTTTSNNEHTRSQIQIHSDENTKKDLEKPVYCPRCQSTSIAEIEPYKDGKRRFRCGKGHRFGIQPNQVREG